MQRYVVKKLDILAYKYDAKLNLYYSKKIEADLKIKAKTIKIINFKNLYFNSLKNINTCLNK